MTIPAYPENRIEQYLDAIAKGGGGGVDVEPLTVTENKTYTAPAGKAYSPVTVNVSGGGGDWKTANVTFINTKASTVYYVYDAFGRTTAVSASSPVTVQFPCTDELPYIIRFNDLENVSSQTMPVFTGEIEFGEGGIFIRGDGTVTMEGIPMT